jgi:hypothetical protein
MANIISKIYLYALITLGILILTCHFNFANSQSILMSSMGMLPGTTNNASAIMFKSNTNCIDVQSGLTIFNRSNGSGEFDINCIVAQQFNMLGMKLFPNPVVSNAKLKLNNLPGSSQDFTVSVWDNQGKLISNTKETSLQLFQGLTLNFDFLIAGSYILKVESPVYLEAIKFIKVK